MASTRSTGEKTPTDPAATGESMTRSVAGNIIERHTIAEHPPASDVEESRRQRIAIGAYYRALRRGFAAGGELEDWLEAERELNEREGSGADG